MKSQYITLILRMRLDPDAVQPGNASDVHGSIQKVGQERIRHFNSFDKFLEIIWETVGEADASPAVTPEGLTKGARDA